MLLLTAIGIGSFLLVVIAEYFATPWRTRMTAPVWFGRRVLAPASAGGFGSTSPKGSK